jgi:hypothetical protein
MDKLKKPSTKLKERSTPLENNMHLKRTELPTRKINRCKNSKKSWKKRASILP